MNRKLQNSYFALTASAALMALGLMAGSPALQGGASPADLQQAMAGVAADVERTEQAARIVIEAATDQDSSGRASSRRSRQAVVMPYFSFAPRG